MAADEGHPPCSMRFALRWRTRLTSRKHPRRDLLNSCVKAGVNTVSNHVTTFPFCRARYVVESRYLARSGIRTTIGLTVFPSLTKNFTLIHVSRFVCWYLSISVARGCHVHTPADNVEVTGHEKKESTNIYSVLNSSSQRSKQGKKQEKGRSVHLP